MSETQNNDDRYEENLAGFEEPDNLEPNVQLMLEDEAVAHAEKLADDDGRIFLPPTPIIQAGQVILPVIMRKGADIGILGDATLDSENCTMLVRFNTKDGRDISEFIGSGVLAAISFQGHMSKSEHFNKN